VLTRWSSLHVCTHTYTHIHTNARLHTHTYTHARTHPHAHTYTLISMHIYSHLHAQNPPLLDLTAEASSSHSLGGPKTSHSQTGLWSIPVPTVNQVRLHMCVNHVCLLLRHTHTCTRAHTNTLTHIHTCIGATATRPELSEQLWGRLAQQT